MDISNACDDGVEATTKAITLYPGVKIVALSMFGEQEYYLRMIRPGKDFFAKIATSTKWPIQSAR